MFIDLKKFDFPERRVKYASGREDEEQDGEQESFNVMASYSNNSLKLNQDEDDDAVKNDIDDDRHGVKNDAEAEGHGVKNDAEADGYGVKNGADEPEIPIMMTKLQWETLQEHRRSELKQACQKLADKPPLNTDITTVMTKNKRLLWPFIVNDKYKLMYCYISKVGSTHWKMAFLVLQGKYKRVEDVPGSRAHDPSLKKLNSYPTIEEISKRLDNYTIFIFVRNPFARVISGYRSKLLQPNPSYHKSVGRTIVKRYRKNPTDEELKGHDVTFPEFVKYLTDPRTKSLDGHFKPMYQMVLPCSVRFNYIGKLETAEEDAKYILENTHVDHLIHFKQTQRNVSHDQATFDKYFAEVPRDDVKKLYQLYYPDFELFGYELPEYMKHWVQ
ncbi:carbohydrate sulfotransferase 11-like [Amphiura filiformis]|uniref:carbohydrate sulfotransferase 11-like n=1 Tax=Amphiura filiformis TaxID=82378 RepID=UPI003B20BBC1